MTQPSGPIKVYIADHHPIYRNAVAEGFQTAPEIKLIGAGKDGAEALAEITALKPQVVVTALMMPRLSGVSFLRSLVQNGNENVKVVLLSGETDDSIVFSAVASGVAGYLLKTVTMEDLISTVVRVEGGETVFSPEISQIIALRVSEPKAEGFAALTPREVEILRLLGEGWTAPQIASTLAISKSTVKAHRHNVYRKLGVNTHTAAVLEGIRQGIIQDRRERAR